jgi:hypothetical protein
MSTSVFLGRQPIFDRKRRTYAYELLYRNGSENVAFFSDPDDATRRVLEIAMLEWGFDRVVGDRFGFINAASGILRSGILDVLPPDRAVIELEEHMSFDGAVLDAIRAAHANGLRFALDDLTTVDRDRLTDVAPYIGVVKSVAQRGLRGADRIGRPGFVFRDALGAAEGPEMVVLDAAGSRIAAARNETTLAEFRAFWNDGGAAERADRPACRNREGFFSASRTRSFQSPTIEQGADHPVVCVTPGDADAYAQWLSKRTGKRYRLPTSAEWLAMAANAPAPGDCKANLADAAFRTKFRDDDVVACDDGFAGTAPVRRFDAPAGTVYDIAGNVREWVSDCPSNCRERTAMGSAWHSTADGAEPTQRETFARDVASNTVGFRVVREID